MALKEEIPVHFLDGEAPFCMTIRRLKGGVLRGRQEEETAARQEATQQTACAIRHREGGAVRGGREDESAV